MPWKKRIFRAISANSLTVQTPPRKSLIGVLPALALLPPLFCPHQNKTRKVSKTQVLRMRSFLGMQLWCYVASRAVSSPFYRRRECSRLGDSTSHHGAAQKREHLCCVYLGLSGWCGRLCEPPAPALCRSPTHSIWAFQSPHSFLIYASLK